MSTNEENLPDLVNLPEMPLQELPERPQYDDVEASDIKLLSFHFRAMGHAFKLMTTSDEIIRGVLATTKLQKDRRDLLRLPYGSESSEKKRNLVYPID